MDGSINQFSYSPQNQIFNIDIECGQSELEQCVIDCIDYYQNNCNFEYNWSLNNTRTNQGKVVCAITLTNLDTSGKFELVASSKSGGRIVFENLSLNSYNKSFYKHIPSSTTSCPDCLVDLAFDILSRLAIENKGSVSGFFMDANNDLRPIVVSNGKSMSHRIKGFGIVDDKNRIYSSSESQFLSDDDDDTDDEVEDNYIVKYLIKDWVDENPQFKEKLNNTSKEDVPELMGQFAIYQRQKDMITSNQLKDIMFQLDGIVKIKGGFKDPNVEMIHKMVV